MASLYCTGPVAIYVELGGQPVFLGHSERAPNISIRAPFSDVYCDLSGPNVPFDKQYQGQDALVSLDLIRFNYGIFLAIAARAAQLANAASNGPGYDPAGNQGALMNQEGLSYFLWLRFSYSAKPAMGGTGIGQGMPAGYRFFAAYLQGPEDYTVGTVPLKIRVTWYCSRLFVASLRTPYGYGGFSLYDGNMGAVINLPIN